MSSQIITTIVLSSISLIATSYLEAETNFLKPKLERNNVVNKGLWIRNKEARNPSDFIFRANSLDVDKILQNSYDSFGTNVKSSPFFTSYVDRKKRSAKNIQEPSTSSLKRCKNNVCSKTNVNKSAMIKSKFISTLKPASVFNDYPYEVAVLLDNKDDTENNFIEKKASNHKQNLREINKTKEIKHKYDRTTENVTSKHLINLKKIPLSTVLDTTYQNPNVTIPKRSMGRHDYETELIKKIEFTENLNDTNVIYKSDRNVFDKENMEWRDPGPVPNVNVYKVLPKFKDTENNKPVNERGLTKVLSMLTKTFKKIMKQHHDIKRIFNTISNVNDDFMKNVEDLTSKYEDINLKYTQIVKIHEDMNLKEMKMRDREVTFANREKELSKNLLEFHNLQKKFLNQQKQFYTVQKLMLAQNEKINIKQNVIAKTQSDISHRQNNFARILKKAKQIYIDSKNWSPAKLNTAIVKPKIKPVTESHPIKVFTTPAPLSTTEPVKINLFSIPPLDKLRNHDQRILEEIDEQPVDELIYKYYFNNTFIDELMKSRILATFMAATEETNLNINKNKRNEKIKMQTTILLPINNTNGATNNIRKKRWIKHPKKNKKKLTTPIPPKRNKVETKVADVGTQTNTVGDLKDMKNDPYVLMAENFCKAIGQNENKQILKWCIEKALRRLQVFDLKVPLTMPTPRIKKTDVPPKTVHTEIPISTTPTLLTTAQKYEIQTNNIKTTEPSNTVMFFPDNEELENKIKEYELLPDPEGTVYFDGSLHASDLGYVKKNSDLDSEGFSDIMPGLDSNSRVEVDPLAFDLQARRRANVHRINERILKMRSG